LNISEVSGVEDHEGAAGIPLASRFLQSDVSGTNDFRPEKFRNKLLHSGGVNASYIDVSVIAVSEKKELHWFLLQWKMLNFGTKIKL
jgi:hypothetical protein